MVHWFPGDFIQKKKSPTQTIATMTNNLVPHNRSSHSVRWYDHDNSQLCCCYFLHCIRENPWKQRVVIHCGDHWGQLTLTIQMNLTLSISFVRLACMFPFKLPTPIFSFYSSFISIYLQTYFFAAVSIASTSHLLQLYLIRSINGLRNR